VWNDVTALAGIFCDIYSFCIAFIPSRTDNKQNCNEHILYSLQSRRKCGGHDRFLRCEIIISVQQPNQRRRISEQQGDKII
jgi:hypothetical protein